MPKRRVLIVEDEVLIALDLESIVANAVDAKVLSLGRARQEFNRTIYRSRPF
jgi:hypothetical protein